jgi:hypothetical protein
MVDRGGLAYQIDEHRHRFAVWAAARAAQRGLRNGSVRDLGRALAACGVVKMVRTPSAWPSTARTFDAVHLKWCRRIVRALSNTAEAQAIFGRAAKLVSVYLKAMIMLAGHEDTPLGRVIHPPIDAILLRRLASNSKLDSPRGCPRRDVHSTVSVFMITIILLSLQESPAKEHI